LSRKPTAAIARSARPRTLRKNVVEVTAAFFFDWSQPERIAFASSATRLCPWHEAAS
jgi:hypothetical protein